jgi:hypothetical protein
LDLAGVFFGSASAAATCFICGEAAEDRRVPPAKCAGWQSGDW